ncbi:MAG: signal peptidase I [Lachnospiraceae bacterium]|nr:signal peptidase I [Lachnospiraceae bacterium]
MASKDTKKSKEQLDWKQNVLIYIHDLIYLSAAVILVFLLLFRVIIVSGDSMYNTLVDGDYLLLVGNLLYKEPKYGDIIVASKDSFDNGSPIIKRVIATEGQTVDIDFEKGIVYVDGRPLQEDYTHTPTNVKEGMQFPLTVDEGCLFVMGDNRNRSKDSRNPEIGLVDCREVLGKAVLLFLPAADPDSGQNKPDYDRIGVIK